MGSRHRSALGQACEDRERQRVADAVVGGDLDREPALTVLLQEHYSSVSGDEVRNGLAKVIALAGIGKAPANRTRKAS